MVFQSKILQQISIEKQINIMRIILSVSFSVIQKFSLLHYLNQRLQKTTNSFLLLSSCQNQNQKLVLF